MIHLLILCLTWTIIYAQNYCAVCIDHTVCRFGLGTGQACGRSSTGGISKFEVETILKAHNDYRAKIANGNESRGAPGPQPPAANMQALVWDEKLAEVAQRWADQCTFKHDKCRDDPRFSVGQNIYWSSGMTRVNWTRAVQSWYDEVDLINAHEMIDRYDYMEYKTGHYAQLVWAETRYIGCGKRTYPGIYRLRGSRPLEYVLSEARKGDRSNFFFGDENLDVLDGMDGAITSASEIPDFDEIADQGSAEIILKEQPGFFGGALFDPNAGQGAITHSQKKTTTTTTTKPIIIDSYGISRPIYGYNIYRPQSNYPAVTYPIYTPYYPYSQYITYDPNDVRQTEETGEETPNESSDENVGHSKKDVNLPRTLQLNTWTKHGWQTQYYDMSDDHILVCNYGPTGNFIGEPIYHIGPPCSKCPTGTICRHGLCA